MTTNKEPPEPPSDGGAAASSNEKNNTAASRNNSNSINDGKNNKQSKQQGKKPRPLVLLGAKPRGLYECDYCSTDLTRAPRIRCADCPDFDLCLECFATEDHERMAQYKRDEEVRKRAQAAAAASLELGESVAVAQQQQQSKGKGGKKARGRGGNKRGRSGSKGTDNDSESPKAPWEEDNADPDALGSYVGGVWVPYFRHKPDHGYIVADSTRYMLCPSFRGVKPLECVEITDNLSSYNEGGEGTKKKISTDDESTDVFDAKDAEMSDIGTTEVTTTSANSNTVNDAPESHDDKTCDELQQKPPSRESETIGDNVKIDVRVQVESRKVGELPQKQPAATGYSVVDDPKNAWTAEEDLRLLDAILTCGLGNWPEIAEHVNGGTNGEGGVPGEGVAVSGKTDKRCMERYLDDFMGRFGYILPPYTMVPVESNDNGSNNTISQAQDSAAAIDASEGDENDSMARKRPRRSIAGEQYDEAAPGFRKTKFRVVPTEELDSSKVWPYPYIPDNTGAKIGDEVARDLWYRSEQSFFRQTSNASSKLDADAIRKEFIERRAQNWAGYEAKVLPPRLEDIKSMHGAELAGYMPRRGDFDMEWQNEAEKTIAEMEFSSDDTKADQDLKLDVIRIFNSKLDEREKRKQFIIDHKLLNYRENQEEMWKREPDERHLIQRMRLFARFHTYEEHESFVQQVLEAKRLRKEIAKLQMYRRMGISSLADAEKYELDKARRQFHRDAWLKKEAENKKAKAEAAYAAKQGVIEGIDIAGIEEKAAFAANQSLQVWKQFTARRKEQKKADNEEIDTDGAAVQSQNKFVIHDKPGYELLSKKEVGLCKRLRILPQTYLDVKKALLSESLAAGIWKKGQSNTVFKIDIEQRDNIVDFVMEAGWIESRPKITDAS
ncbi:hypothetical protein ACHAXM_003893 [Skeletonema potamos]